MFSSAGRAGGRLHGDLLCGDDDQDLGRRLHPAQGQLPQKPVEHHGLHRRCVRVSHHWAELRLTNRSSWGGSPGLVVMGEGSCSKGCEFEYRCCILDLICCKNLYCLFEKTENKLKRGRVWPIF